MYIYIVVNVLYLYIHVSLSIYIYIIVCFASFVFPNYTTLELNNKECGPQIRTLLEISPRASSKSMETEIQVHKQHNVVVDYLCIVRYHYSFPSG